MFGSNKISNVLENAINSNNKVDLDMTGDDGDVDITQSD